MKNPNCFNPFTGKWEYHYGFKIQNLNQPKVKEKVNKTHSKKSSLTPKSIRDSDAVLLEEIRQIKAVIIHFATLDKMPTLPLLDRDHLIAYIVTIAQKILKDFPPKSASLKPNKLSDSEIGILETVEKIRKESGFYIWAFPITYRNKDNSVEKITFGWEVEWASGQTNWYKEECSTYYEALNEGIKAYQ